MAPAERRNPTLSPFGLQKTRLPTSEEDQRIYDALAAIPLGHSITIEAPDKGKAGAGWLRGLQQRLMYMRKRAIQDASLAGMLTAEQERAADPLNAIDLRLRKSGEDWVLVGSRPRPVVLKASWQSEGV